ASPVPRQTHLGPLRIAILRARVAGPSVPVAAPGARVEYLSGRSVAPQPLLNARRPALPTSVRPKSKRRSPRLQACAIAVQKIKWFGRTRQASGSEAPNL